MSLLLKVSAIKSTGIEPKRSRRPDAIGSSPAWQALAARVVSAQSLMMGKPHAGASAVRWQSTTSPDNCYEVTG